MNFYEKYIEDLSERDKYILNARDKENKTFVEISKELGISAVYISKIYKRIKKNEEIYKNLDYASNDLDKTIYFLGLSSSINNALHRAGIYTISDLKKAYKTKRIYKLRSIGPKSLKAIKKSLMNKFSYDEEFMKYLIKYKCTINDCMVDNNGLLYYEITVEDYLLKIKYKCVVEVEDKFITRFFFESGKKYNITKLLMTCISELLYNEIQ